MKRHRDMVISTEGELQSTPMYDGVGLGAGDRLYGPASPAVVEWRVLRVLGTAVMLLEQVRVWIIAGLQFDIALESLDFLTCQQNAAVAPEDYDV